MRALEQDIHNTTASILPPPYHHLVSQAYDRHSACRAVLSARAVLRSCIIMWRGPARPLPSERQIYTQWRLAPQGAAALALPSSTTVLFSGHVEHTRSTPLRSGTLGAHHVQKERLSRRAPALSSSTSSSSPTTTAHPGQEFCPHDSGRVHGLSGILLEQDARIRHRHLAVVAEHRAHAKACLHTTSFEIHVLRDQPHSN